MPRIITGQRQQGALSIDWSNPITKGIIWAYSPQAAAATGVRGKDVAGVLLGTQTFGDSGAGPAKRVTDCVGISMDNTAPVLGTDNYTYIDLSSTDLATRLAAHEATLVHYLWNPGWTTGSENGWDLLGNDALASHYTFDGQCYISTFRSTRLQFTPNISLNVQPHVVAITASDKANQWVFYQHGTPIKSTTASWQLATTQTVYRSVSGYWNRHRIYLTLIYNRALGPAEVMSLTMNPFQVYRRSPARNVIASAAAAAAANFRWFLIQ